MKKINFFIKNILEILFSVPRILYFNFKILPLRHAFKLPFMISYKIKLNGINKKTFIVEADDYRFASYRIGFGGSNCGIRENAKGMLSVEGNGRVVIRGKAGFSRGIIIEACDGEIIFGDNFRCNYSTTIYCKDSEVIFGENVVLGWGVTIKNGDGHMIVEDGKIKEMSKPIIIGDNVWICSYVDILKGVNVGRGSVVAYRSLLTRANGESNVMFAGMPANVIRTNISWKE